MKKIFTTILLAGVAVGAFAQQDAQFSQNMYNRMSVNPAYAGSNDAICATLLARSQWVGFPGAPKTALLSADMPVKMLFGGVGLSITGDKLGFDQNIIAKAAYAYRRQLGPGKISAGIAAGIYQKSTDGEWIYNQPNDPNIPVSKVAGMAPDFDFGIYYHTNKLYFGVSATHLSEAGIDYSVLTTYLARHYFIMGGYKYTPQSLPDWTFLPSILIKSDAASTQVDFNLNVMHKDKYWAGFSYRIQDALVLLVGMNINQNWKFGYSYDVTTSEIKNYSSGSHEIMLGYCFKVKPPTPVNKYRNVRFL